MREVLVDVIKKRQGLSEASYRKLERWLARKIPGETGEAIIVDGLSVIVILTRNATERDVIAADRKVRAWFNPPVVAPSPTPRR
jgi:hypothetical protein